MIWGGYRAAATSGSMAMRPQYSHSEPIPPSNQLEALEAGVALASDDDVVVDGDAQRPGGIDDLLGHVDIGARRGGIARGVVVHQDDGAGRQLERALDDLAHVDRRVIDRALLLHLVG